MRLFIYKIICMLKNPGQLFWVFIFPILLGTLFSFTFGSILKSDGKMDPISAAAVTKSENPYFEQMLDALSEGEEPFLNVKYSDDKTARDLLNNGEISGIFYIDAEPSLTVDSNEIEPQVLSALLDRYASMSEAIKDIIDSGASYELFLDEDFYNNWSFIKTIDLKTTEDGMFRENFYSLIAMTCLYGGFFGLSSAAELKAGESAVGARLQVSPVEKSRFVTADSLAMLTVAYAIVLTLLLYINYVLKIELGSNMPLICLSCLCGSFCGVMLGMFIGVALNISQAAKEGITVAVSLVLCFFSGLMQPQMRFFIEHNAPIFNRINPAALLADSFYSLDTYGAGERYFSDIALLTVIGAVLAILCVIMLRRKQYAGS